MAKEIQFLLYSMPDENGKVQVVIKDETIWCTQKAMAELFGINKSGISRHIANIYKDGELTPDTTVAKIATVVNRGIRGEVEEPVDFYNLDVIISVGYRVNSARATRFRQRQRVPRFPPLPDIARQRKCICCPGKRKS